MSASKKSDGLLSVDSDLSQRLDDVSLPGLIWWESLGYPDQRWPEAAMDESDLAVGQPTNENIFRFRHRLKEREDLVTLRLRPPTAFDWLVREPETAMRR